MNEKQASDIARFYLKSILADDISKIDGVKRDSKKVKALIKSLARNVATSVSNATLIKEIKEFDGDVIDPNTIASYLDILTRLFIIDNQQAYDMNYRSTTRVAKTPKRHFIDPSLAVAALEMSPSMLLKDLNFFGFIFESLVIRDLKIYAKQIEDLSIILDIMIQVMKLMQLLNLMMAHGEHSKLNWDIIKLIELQKIF